MKNKAIIALVGVFLVLLAAVLAGTVYKDGTIRLIYGSVQAKDVEFTYDIESDGTATITGVKNPKKLRGNVTIPAEIDGYKVKKIEDLIFDADNDFITGVTVSEGIENLGVGFFYGAKNLFKVSIPDSVKSIGEYAFYRCEHVRDKESNGLTYVDGCLVAASTSDEDVRVKDGTRLICDSIFKHCLKIKSVYIPESVEYIGRLEPSRGPFIEQITVAEGNKAYTSEGNCLTDLRSKTVVDGRATSKIPDDPEIAAAIGDEAFVSCEKLEQIEIPGNIKTVGKSAFVGTNLKSVEIKDGVERIEECAFGNFKGDEVIIPKSVKYIAKDAFPFGTKLIRGK